MARAFDARPLVGRTFADVLDKIAPGWWICAEMGIAPPIGPTPAASEEEIRDAEIRLIVEELRKCAVVLIDAEGAAVPRWVWLSGRWTFYRDKERLVATAAAGEKVECFGPRFARPGVKGSGRTGTAGRPTSWHLIEAECRRRYNKGERHADGAIESPKAWADVLLPWLQEAHPDEPPGTPKTTRNNLSKLLRELKKREPEIGA